MIIQGVLSAIGPSVSKKGMTGVTHLEFDDRDDLLVNQNQRIAMPTYLYNKLASELGKSVALSITDNTRLVLAIRTRKGKVYKHEFPTNIQARTNCRPISASVISMGLLWSTVVFFPSFFAWLYWRSQTGKMLKSVATAFDGDAFNKSEDERISALLDTDPDMRTWCEADVDKANTNMALMTKAVEKHTGNYVFASASLKNDIDLAWLACNRYINSFGQVSHSLKINVDFVIKVIKLKPDHAKWILFELPEEMHNNESFMFEALLAATNPGEVFKVASERLRAKEAFVLKCIEFAPGTYQFASAELRSDPEIAEFLFAQPDGGTFFSFASKSLLSDKRLVIKAYQSSVSGPALYEALPPELQSDNEVISLAKEKIDWAFFIL